MLNLYLRLRAPAGEQVTTEGLLAWLLEEKLPPFLEFTDENQEAIFSSGITINVRLPRRDASHGGVVEQSGLDTFGDRLL